LDTRITAQAPPPLRTAFLSVDLATDRLIKAAKLAA